MVPKHIKLNNTQKQEFLDKYNIYKEDRIPEISRFDPVAKAIGLQPGEVCKIIRPSRTSIEGVYYRICLNK
jgi:DNA-directed RNA polymerase I, II, and III subunit RPABC1